MHTARVLSEITYVCTVRMVARWCANTFVICFISIIEAL